MKVKEESETIGLKLNIQKMKIMASGPITSLEIDGETVSNAGVQPRLIQGIWRRDGFGDLFIYLFIKDKE